MVYSSNTLQNQLNQLHQQSKGAVQQQNWRNFTPQELDFVPNSTLDFMKQGNQTIGEGTDAATAASLIQAQNRYNKHQLELQQQQHQLAQQNFIDPQDASTIDGATTPVGTGNPDIPGNLNPNAPMKTMNFHGMSYTVNSQVADTFQSFLTDLWKMGYHPVTIQGLNVRNIKGTNTPSLHSYGFAIDIDPSKNPVYNDNNPADDVYALPPSVAALAAKYGLSWGGSWNSYKDYMHFSVPYGGRE